MYAAMGTRELMAKHAAWHNKIADRLTYVAARPWLTIPTDPPEPDSFVDPPSAEMLQFFKQIERSAATD